MEALDFLKEAKRMCLAIGCCSDCQLGYGCVVDDVKKVPDRVLESNCLVVEQWSKEHPIITNAQKFKEVFGEKRLSDLIDCKIRNASGDEIIVDMQKTEWWDEPYKEPEHE